MNFPVLACGGSVFASVSQLAMPVNATTFPIVALGFSESSVPALSELLAHLPAQSGISFVLLSHGGAKDSDSLAENLSSISRIPVKRFRKPTQLQPDHF
jgi:two-component system, chemotaxis family, CheB/CheR fusion protein